jgi:hypothetical protein
MLPRRLFPAVLAAGLLLSPLGCITEPPLPVNGTGSYALDGVVRTCVVQADLTYPALGNQPLDQLDVVLLTTPEPATGPEAVALTFSKFQGQPPTAYELKAMRYQTAAGLVATFPQPTVALQETNGSYAGTFAGTASSSTTTPPLVLTAGTFAEVRP